MALEYGRTALFGLRQAAAAEALSPGIWVETEIQTLGRVAFSVEK